MLLWSYFCRTQNHHNVLTFWKSRLLPLSLLKWKSTRTKTLALNRCGWGVSGLQSACDWAERSLPSKPARGMRTGELPGSGRLQPRGRPVKKGKSVQFHKARPCLTWGKSFKITIPLCHRYLFSSSLFTRGRVKPRIHLILSLTVGKRWK